jgi:hypothetical protein
MIWLARGLSWFFASSKGLIRNKLFVARAQTIIFSKADQFQWPAVISVIAVYVARGTYMVFVRRGRGHLVHMPSCIKPPLEDNC